MVLIAWSLLAALTLAPSGAAASGRIPLELPEGPYDTYISIGDASVTEGDSPGASAAEFVVEISGYWNPDWTSISILFATWGYGEVAGATATEGEDYEETNGLLAFYGLGTKTVTVPIIGDTIAEDDEIFFLKLFGDWIPAWVDVFGTGTIVDDDGNSGVMCGRWVATHVGSEGPETIFGTAGDDVIVALGGDDTVYAGSGNDVVCAGDGRDVIYAGAGRDRVYGQRHADLIYGGSGRDRLKGGLARDWIAGGKGDDVIHGGTWGDTLYGRGGADTIYGGAGHDELSGGTGNADDCDGGTGTDTHIGGCETMTSIP